MIQTLKKKQIKIIFFIFVLALLLRFILAFYCDDTPIKDASGYDALAVNIINGKGFSLDGELTAWREPLYPFFLSSIYYFFGHNYKAVRITQAILGALVCIFVFLIAKMLFNEKVGFISALIASVNPSLVRITTYLLTENLYTFLFMIAILLLLRQARSKNYINLFCLGAVLGLVALTRSLAIIFPLFVLLLGKNVIYSNGNLKKYILNSVIFLTLFVLTILPWTLRNWFVFHELIPISSRMGGGVYLSYVPRDGKFFELDPNDRTIKKAGLIKSQSEQNKFFLKETIRHIKNHPISLIKIELLKILYFWSPFDWEIIGYGVYNFIYGFVLPFFFIGIFTTLKRFKYALLVCLPIIYSFFIALVTHGSPRFRLPVEPYIIIIASAVICSFIDRFSKRIYPFLFVISCFFLNLLIYLNSLSVKIFARSILHKLYLW